MIDYTTLQLTPIPPAIAELQNSNSLLKKRNEALIYALIGLAVVVLVIAKITNNNKTDDKTERKD